MADPSAIANSASGEGGPVLEDLSSAVTDAGDEQGDDDDDDGPVLEEVGEVASPQDDDDDDGPRIEELDASGTPILQQ